MIEIEKIEYPGLNAIIRLYPNPGIVLGREIFWQEKRDGSNIGVYLDENDEIALRSRHMVVADVSFREAFMRTEESSRIKEFILDSRNTWNDEIVVFGEMLLHGKSPTKTEFHEMDEFILFDVYSSKSGGLLPYMLVHQHAYHYDLKIVELYGSSSHTTVDSLLEFRDKMLKIAKDNGREGVVGKTFEDNIKYLYFKEKLDTPKLEKMPRKIDDGEIILPTLPESEILGALDKVLVDMGPEMFKDKKKPCRYSRSTFEKSVKHMCEFTGSLFGYYTDKLGEIK